MMRLIAISQHRGRVRIMGCYAEMDRKGMDAK